jgi:hypothetical protein
LTSRLFASGSRTFKHVQRFLILQRIERGADLLNDGGPPGPTQGAFELYEYIESSNSTLAKHPNQNFEPLCVSDG